MLAKFGKFLREIVPVFLVALVIALLCKHFLVDNRVIPTASMEPTVPTGGRMLVNQLAYRFGEPAFQDIVIFEPNDSTKEAVGRPDDMLKRVIGLPGDVVQVTDAVLYINGEAIDEPYLMEPMYYEFGPVTVPEGHVFLLGDNRNNSYDSHLWEEPFVPIENVEGRALLLYWPLDRFGSF
ncbi:MAG: signal peptidase I [Firmicutes bacterium]|nr:signal peptidase I [Bacillota bacterium]